ncbi:peptidoglycan DD-metalloendopeptidase family protein [candidate division KSB1 bacterium]|nr:peptidoglycan DD-metalloendopeptidase family protein [candidate division KSB1 bacterium]
MDVILFFTNKTAGPILHLLGTEVLYSSVLFIFVFVLSYLLRKKSPYIQTGLWTLLLIRLVLPPDLASDFSLGTVIHTISEINQTGEHPDVLEPWKSAILKNKYKTASKGSSENPSAGRTVIAFALFCFWVCGVCMFFVLFIARFNKYKKIISESEKIHSPQYLALLYKWEKIFKVKRPVSLVSSHCNISPFTTGLVKPVIYIPGILLESVRLEHLEAVIAHEMAHIQRYDTLWIKCQNILQCIYFFHPAVWIANKRINRAREFLCDGRVLMTKNIAREEYGNGLINILKLNLPGMDCPAFIPGFKSPHQTMKNRIEKIKGEKLMNKSHIFTSFIFILLSGILLLPMAGKSEKNNPAKSGQQQGYFTQLEEIIKQEMDSTTKIHFTKPLKDYVITAQYGAEFRFYNNFIKHKGIDLRAERGTDVYTSADGTVFKAVETFTKNKGYGKYIILQHQDGFKTLYAHLDNINVKEGQNVKTGQIIGQLGNTGQSTGPHLHFELIHQDEHKDPSDYIDF